MNLWPGVRLSVQGFIVTSHHIAEDLLQTACIYVMHLCARTDKAGILMSRFGSLWLHWNSSCRQKWKSGHVLFYFMIRPSEWHPVIYWSLITEAFMAKRPIHTLYPAQHGLKTLMVETINKPDGHNNNNNSCANSTSQLQYLCMSIFWPVSVCCLALMYGFGLRGCFRGETCQELQYLINHVSKETAKSSRLRIETYRLQTNILHRILLCLTDWFAYNSAVEQERTWAALDHLRPQHLGFFSNGCRKHALA